MNLALEILFVVLVLSDMVITYAVLESGKGRETAFARHYIKYPAGTAAITVLGVAAILILVNLAQAFILLIPASGVFAWACWHNWRIYHA